MSYKKKFINAGLLTAVVSLLIAGSAFAKTTTSIQATIESHIKVIKDGQELTLRNEQGKKVEPVMIEGSVYVPLRAISETVGWEVDWDNSVKSITLTEPDSGIDPNQPLNPVEPPVRPISLVDFPGTIDSKLLLSKVQSDLQIGTVSFAQGGILKGKSARTTIDFGGESFDTLNLFMGVKKTAPTSVKNSSTNVNEPVEVRFLEIDGKKEISFFTTNIQPTDGVKKFTVDLKGKKKIRIAITSDLTDTQLILGDPMFE